MVAALMSSTHILPTNIEQATMDAALVTATYVLRHRCHGIDALPIAQRISDMLVEQPTWDQVFESNQREKQALRTIKWLYAKGYDDTRILCDCDYCDRRGSTHQDHERTYLDLAAARGFTSVFQFIMSHSRKSWTKNGLRAAAANGHLEIVKCIVDNHPHVAYAIVGAMESAVKHNQLAVVQYLDQLGVVGVNQSPSYRDPDKMYGQEEAPAFAARCGHLEIVEYLWGVDHDRTPRQFQWKLVPHSAATYGHLHVVEWLYHHTPLRCSPQAALRCGSVPLFQLLLDKNTDDIYIQDMMGAAAHEGHYELLELLASQGEYSDLMDRYALPCVAKRGDLALVQQFYERTPSYSRSDAMTSAIERGHLDVVKYLHEERGHRWCNRFDAECAARNGHIEVLRYIHKHGITPLNDSDILWTAILSNHLEIVRFLHGVYVYAGEYQSQRSYADRCLETGDLELLK